MMRMGKLGSVCAKGRRWYSAGSGGDVESGFVGALGTAWRTLARCASFYVGYKIFGEYLRPIDNTNVEQRIEEADSDIQTYLERIKYAERYLVKLQDGPKH